MKSKFNLFASIFQIIVGLAAIASFIVLTADGMLEKKFIITLLLAIAFVIIGIKGIIDYKKS